MAPPAVKVRGLRTLNRDLKKIDVEFSKDTRKKYKQIVETAAVTARATEPHLTGELALETKVASRLKGAAIVNRLPQAGVIEYGGDIAPRGVTIHFERRLAINDAVDAHTRDIEDQVGDLLDRIAHSNGFDQP